MHDAPGASGRDGELKDAFRQIAAQNKLLINNEARNSTRIGRMQQQWKESQNKVQQLSTELEALREGVATVVTTAVQEAVAKANAKAAIRTSRLQQQAITSKQRATELEAQLELSRESGRDFLVVGDETQQQLAELQAWETEIVGQFEARIATAADVARAERDELQRVHKQEVTSLSAELVLLRETEKRLFAAVDDAHNSRRETDASESRAENLNRVKA